jgi:hypothetical protein
MWRQDFSQPCTDTGTYAARVSPRERETGDMRKTTLLRNLESTEKPGAPTYVASRAEKAVGAPDQIAQPKEDVSTSDELLPVEVLFLAAPGMYKVLCSWA